MDGYKSKEGNTREANTGAGRAPSAEKAVHALVAGRNPGRLLRHDVGVILRRAIT